jgi:hypothetical protein
MHTKTKNERKSSVVAVCGLVLIVLIALQGCAKPAGRSDFLASSVELTQCPESKEKLWWERSGFNWHAYKHVMIDPLAVVGDAAGGKNAINHDELHELHNYFLTSVTEKLSPEFTIVKDPGPDVLRIRPAITRIDRANPLLNAVTTVAVFVPLDMGGASIEVEFLDSLTGERLAAMVETKSGTPFQVIASLNQFGHAKNAMDDWASELKVALLENP